MSDFHDAAKDGLTPTELEAVRVIGQRPPPDPFAFRNPVEVEGTVFSRAWNEPPSLEEVGLRGGYVQLGINKGLELAGKGIRKLPGWKLQIRDAQARPPPLDEAQKRFPGAVVGGIAELDLLVTGSPEEVRAQVHDAIERTQGRRFVVGPGCVAGIHAPEANFRAVLEASGRKVP